MVNNYLHALINQIYSDKRYYHMDSNRHINASILNMVILIGQHEGHTEYIL